MTSAFAPDEYLPSVIDLSKGPFTKIILPTSPPASGGGIGQIQWVETASGALIANIFSSESTDSQGRVSQQTLRIGDVYPLLAQGARPNPTTQSVVVQSGVIGQFGTTGDSGTVTLTLNTPASDPPAKLATQEARIDLQPTLHGATALTRTIIDALGQSNFLQWLGAKSNLAVQIGSIASLAVVAGNHAVSIPLARAWTTAHSFFAAFITAAPTDVSNVFAVGVQDLANGTMKINSSVSQNISVAYLSIGN